jgi:1-carboxybiuret hydrolase
MTGADFSALDIAAGIRRGDFSAAEMAHAALERSQSLNPRINAFTAFTAERALAEANAIDARRKTSEALPPLAGVPYAVKNLFDVEGRVTLAGSSINRTRAPASSDAALVAQMRNAGAVLVGETNMDEYAYGFTTENHHYGDTRNPHDTTRSAGGSSGGSAAAVAAGCVPLALGSDTNGSIRVPASFCGIFGLKPTYGRLPRRGAYLFCPSLDHVGPFARSVADLRACYAALGGQDEADTSRVPRIARLGGYFDELSHPEALQAADTVQRTLGAADTVRLPEVERARAAAFVITAAEAAAQHLPDLQSRAADFGPLVRDRLLAGALVPAAWVLQAQRFRSWFRDRVREAFATYDVLIAPATPFAAIPLGTDTGVIGGRTVPLRPGIGVLTQPISFIGLPVVTVPVWPGKGMPIGIQIIAAPWRETDALRIAARLEAEGVVRAPVASLSA